MSNPQGQRFHRIRAAIAASYAGLSFLCFAAAAAAAPAKVALIHFNPVLRDVAANLPVLEALVTQAFQNGANVVVTPELSTTGFSITRQQVTGGLGFINPYPQLDNIKALAMLHHGYVFVAIAEVAPPQAVYNTVVIYGPDGLVGTQEKRGLSGWHDRGILPFEPIHTVYGDIGTMICSDSYLPDWLRILTLKGADVILLPANWWGRNGQEEIWQTRARENGVWFFTANRWGTEVDTRFTTPFTYYMNDAPSAFITPDGDIQLLYRSEEDPAGPHNTILYYTVDVPHYRIGTALNSTYSVDFRKPSAYAAIGNTYYRPDLGNQPAPGLPPAGVTYAASMAYQPSFFPSPNLVQIKQIWAQTHQAAQVLVLPGLGLTPIPIKSSNTNWQNASPWSDLQSFVESNGLLLLVTTVIESPQPGSYRESLLVVRPGKPPLVQGQIHDSIGFAGTGQPPLLIDLPAARVGLLTGRDALFPETGTALAKAGADLVLISSDVGAASTSHDVNSPHYFWEPAALLRMWKTRTDEVVHLVASDWTGNGAVIENTFGVIGRLDLTGGATPMQTLDLDSNFVRTKYLNTYYAFDLQSLVH